TAGTEKKRPGNRNERVGRMTRTSAAEKFETIRLVEESGLPVKKALAELKIARSTFYRWYERYQAAGYDGLEDAPRRQRQFWNRIPDSRVYSELCVTRRVAKA